MANKKRIKINEVQLKQIVTNSVKRILNEVDYSNFDFSKTPGIKLPSGDDSGWYATPKEIKEKLFNLQKALLDVMDLDNGQRAGKDFHDAFWDRCYDFYKCIS